MYAINIMLDMTAASNVFKKKKGMKMFLKEINSFGHDTWNISYSYYHEDTSYFCL